MNRPVDRKELYTVRYLPVVLGALLALAGSSLVARPAAATGAANGSTVLIFSKSVVGGVGSLEATTAAARGLTVEIADDAAWAAKSSADFATYRAIILGDPDCVQNTNLITGPVSNKNVWGSAVTGNVIVVGTDAASHAGQGGDVLTDAAIGFVTERPGRTGAYISLSCYYLDAPAGTPVPLLDGISPGGFMVHGVGCFNAAHLVATDPGLAGLNDASISNWNCSVHEGFDKWPSDFLVTGMVSDDVAGGFTASDGTVGTAYIVARGLQLAALGLSVSPTNGTGLIGTAHTVTAQLVDASTGAPLANKRLAFQIVSGPNAGAAGTCSPATCNTDASGTATFTYTGAGGVGNDAILAFADANNDRLTDVGEAQTTARQTWGLCGDGTVQAGEQCDPGAASTCTAPSVCLPSCTCGCATDNDCVDSNACNGQESCNTDTHQCVPGTPVPCADGNACNGAETCNPATGACVAGTPATAGTACDADANPCSADVCNGAGVCTHTGNAPQGTQCDDGIFCDGSDSCDGTGRCVSNGNPCPGTACNQTCQEATRSCFDPAGTSCNDGDAGTLDDVCTGAGSCTGEVTVNRFAVLRWPLPSTTLTATLGFGSRVGGSLCAENVSALQFSQIEGNAVSPKATGTAMQFTFANRVTGGVLTAGGHVTLGKHSGLVGSVLDTSGDAPELTECAAAGLRVNERRTFFAGLSASPGLNLGSVKLKARQSRIISAQDVSGASRVVVVISDLQLNEYGNLTFVGGGATTELIVHVLGPMKLSRRAEINLQNLLPEQVLFVVEGAITTRNFTKVAGTLLGAAPIRIGYASTVDGAIIGNKSIRLSPWSMVTLSPFQSW